MPEWLFQGRVTNVYIQWVCIYTGRLQLLQCWRICRTIIADTQALTGFKLVRIVRSWNKIYKVVICNEAVCQIFLFKLVKIYWSTECNVVLLPVKTEIDTRSILCPVKHKEVTQWIDHLFIFPIDGLYIS